MADEEELARDFHKLTQLLLNVFSALTMLRIAAIIPKLDGLKIKTKKKADFRLIDWCNYSDSLQMGSMQRVWLTAISLFIKYNFSKIVFQTVPVPVQLWLENKDFWLWLIQEFISIGGSELYQELNVFV